MGITTLFRKSMFLNGILCSIEVLYGINSEHIDKLEKCDRSLMRRWFDCTISTPVESYYLETSELPVRFILMGRRLMYLWTILHKSDIDTSCFYRKSSSCCYCCILLTTRVLGLGNTFVAPS